MAADQRVQPLRRPRLRWVSDGPPGHDDAVERAIVDEALQLANTEAAVRLRDRQRVSSILGLSAFVVHDDEPASAALVERLYDTYWSPPGFVSVSGMV